MNMIKKRPKGCPKKILVVEDDEDFLSILKIKLESEGFFVVTAEDGENGFDAFEKEKPDLIFSDVLLPKMDGIEMVKKIRESDKNVPIIFLSNLTDVDHSKDMERLGSEYLIKANLKISDIVDKAKNKLGI